MIKYKHTKVCWINLIYIKKKFCNKKQSVKVYYYRFINTVAIGSSIDIYLLYIYCSTKCFTYVITVH